MILTILSTGNNGDTNIEKRLLDTVGEGMKVLVAQSCPTLCDPMDHSPQGYSVHEFFRQEYWCGLTFPSPGDLLNPGIKPASIMVPALLNKIFTTSTTLEAWGRRRWDKLRIVVVQLLRCVQLFVTP